MAIKWREVSSELMRSVTLHVRMCKSLSSEDVIGTLQQVFDSEPSLIPERFGVNDRMRTCYTRSAFQDLKSSCELNRGLFISGCNGSYSLQRIPEDEETWILRFDRHFFKDATIGRATDIIGSLPIIFCFLHAVSKREVEFIKKFRLGWDESDGYALNFSSAYEHGIPTLAWRTYFGSRYIRHFGRQRLLSSPAYSVREISAETICLQLTSDITDIKANWDTFHDFRQKVITHLGQESFQQPGTGEQPSYLDDYGPHIIPATSIPEELVSLRKKADREIELLRIQSERPPAIESLEHIYANPGRYRIVTDLVEKDHTERFLIDEYRKEFIRFPDSESRNKAIDYLLENGADFQDYAKHLEWGKRSKSCLPVDGPVSPTDSRFYNLNLLKRSSPKDASMASE